MRYTATSVALVLWIVFMATVTIGVGVGYTVDSPSEIPSEFDEAQSETTAAEMDCSAENRYGPVVGPVAETVNGVFGIEQSGECSEAATEFVDTAVGAALSAAEWIAYVGYYLSLVIPSQIVEAALMLLTFLPAGAMVLKMYSDVRALAT